MTLPPTSTKATTKPTLIITRGLPASGKSTMAKAWVDEDTDRRARVNRDDLRAMLHGGRLATQEQEVMVNKGRNAFIASLLHRGVSVVADDMNLQQRYARELHRLAALHNAEFLVWDLTDVPLETCIERDASRAVSVGETVIRDLHKRYLAGKSYPLPFPDDMSVASSSDSASTPQPYVPKPNTVRAVMVDIDGTVALMAARSPYDETRVHEDRPNQPVIDTVRAMYAMGHQIIFLSGRTSDCRAATEEWLHKHLGIYYHALHMRSSGDMRKDSIVKRELFDAHVRDYYNVVAVFDDRNQVVDMWRSMGLAVFQVAPGDF